MALFLNKVGIHNSLKDLINNLMTELLYVAMGFGARKVSEDCSFNGKINISNKYNDARRDRKHFTRTIKNLFLPFCDLFATVQQCSANSDEGGVVVE